VGYTRKRKIISAGRIKILRVDLSTSVVSGQGIRTGY